MNFFLNPERSRWKYGELACSWGKGWNFTGDQRQMHRGRVNLTFWKYGKFSWISLFGDTVKRRVVGLLFINLTYEGFSTVLRWKNSLKCQTSGEVKIGDVQVKGGNLVTEGLTTVHGTWIFMARSYHTPLFCLLLFISTVVRHSSSRKRWGKWKRK